MKFRCNLDELLGHLMGQILQVIATKIKGKVVNILERRVTKMTKATTPCKIDDESHQSNSWG